MNEEIEGVLICFEENVDLNESFYYLDQLPQNWIFKGRRLYNDALLIYNAHKKQSDYIIKQFEKLKFPFERFYSETLDEYFEKIPKNKNFFIPDFKTFYLLSHLALENILKGIFLDKNQNLLGFKKLPEEIKSHNLKQLFKISTNIIFFGFEENFVNKINKCFSSYNRYPISSKTKQTNPKDLKNTLEADDKFLTVMLDLMNDVFEEEEKALKSIIDRLLPDILNVENNSIEHLQSVVSKQSNENKLFEY